MQYSAPCSRAMQYSAPCSLGIKHDGCTVGCPLWGAQMGLPTWFRVAHGIQLENVCSVQQGSAHSRETQTRWSCAGGSQEAT